MENPEREKGLGGGIANPVVLERSDVFPGTNRKNSPRRVFLPPAVEELVSARGEGTPRTPKQGHQGTPLPSTCSPAAATLWRTAVRNGLPRRPQILYGFT